jgi:hypothetical protein
MTTNTHRPEDLLIERRAAFEQAMARHFARPGEPTAADRRAATQLAGLLIASLDGAPDGTAAAPDDRDVAAYYGRFGDALSPILRDVLGTDLPRAFLARSIDGYWRSVRAELGA